MQRHCHCLSFAEKISPHSIPLVVLQAESQYIENLLTNQFKNALETNIPPIPSLSSTDDLVQNLANLSFADPSAQALPQSQLLTGIQASTHGPPLHPIESVP
ncbi:hypothetical protein C8J56DRAFT_1062845 [Mycena floridula]|nr:hypothetical protein C8J56DRAFT_1062845 [Mycena floridula]